MKIKIFTLISAFLFPFLATAADIDSTIEHARQAIHDGFPKAAITPLTEAIKQAPSSDKHHLGLLLARARLASGHYQEAIKALDTYCNDKSDESRLLRAYALAAQGDFDKAASLVSSLAPQSTEAALLLARIHFEQGDLNAAKSTLLATTAISNPDVARLLLDLQLSLDDPKIVESTISDLRKQDILPAAELDTATGRLRLLQNRPTEAADIFHNVLDSENLPAPLRTNARNGLALALVSLGAEARAREILHTEISENKDAWSIRTTLKQWLSLERAAGNDPSADLKTWTADTSRRAIEARLQLARLDIELKRPDAAMNSLAELLAAPGLPAQDILRARLLLAEARIAAGQSDAAFALLDTLPKDNTNPHINFRLADLRGRSLSAQNNHHRAFEEFMQAFQHAESPEEKNSTAINAIISALAAGDLPKARESYNLLLANSPQNPELLRWAFLLAAAEARDGNIDNLAAITRHAQAGEYAFSAKLALAEWRLSRGDPAGAERTLNTAKEQVESEPARASALAAAAIFTADNSGTRTREEIITECRNFLATYPDSPETTDITFKLGELYSLSGDYTAAEDILYKLSQSLTSTEDAALAKFLAAQAASFSMSREASTRAMEWLDSIAQGKSSLRQRARLEQASLLLRDRKFSDAITLYDRILTDNPSREVRSAALMEKADTLYTIATTNPDKFLEAASAYAAISTSKDIPTDWRDQAACKRAASLAAAGNTDAALASYREIFSKPAGEFADPFWFYKAGIEAGNILEKQQDWRGAIAVYDQLAEANGPQRDELKQRARRLRLEHFIWEN